MIQLGRVQPNQRVNVDVAAGVLNELDQAGCGPLIVVHLVQDVDREG
jgi:hypothetical protein